MSYQSHVNSHWSQSSLLSKREVLPRQRTRESPEGAYPQNALKISATSSPMVIRLRFSSST
jgi:hypothetical protein